MQTGLIEFLQFNVIEVTHVLFTNKWCQRFYNHTSFVHKHELETYSYRDIHDIMHSYLLQERKKYMVLCAVTAVQSVVAIYCELLFCFCFVLYLLICKDFFTLFAV